MATWEDLDDESGSEKDEAEEEGNFSHFRLEGYFSHFRTNGILVI